MISLSHCPVRPLWPAPTAATGQLRIRKFYARILPISHHHLDPDTGYYFAVSAYNGLESACSNEVSHLLLPSNPLSAIEIISFMKKSNSLPVGMGIEESEGHGLNCLR